jgi:DNA-binding XRE family transcriptional regulator
MTMQTLVLGDTEYVVLKRAEYDRLVRPGAGRTGRLVVDDADLPPLPTPHADGTVPALAFGRALLARKLIQARRQAGLTQAELARRAGVRAETINRLEKARHHPDERTFAKIEAVLKAAGVRV